MAIKSVVSYNYYNLNSGVKIVKMSRFLNENRKKLPKTQKMDVAEHRRELMKKVIDSKQKKVAKSTPTKTKTAYSADAKAEIKKLKQKLHLATQNNSRLQREKSDLQKKNRNKQKELRKLRAEKDNFDQKIKDIELEYQEKTENLNQEIKQKNEEIKQLKDETAWIKSEKLTPGDDVREYIENQNFQIELLTVLFEAVMKKNVRLAEQITQVREDRNTYHKQANQYEKEKNHLARLQAKLHGKVKTLTDKNKTLLRLNHSKAQLKNASVQELIQLLIDRCSPETIADYRRLETLVQYYYKVLDSTQQRKFSYGYIEETNNEFWLHDINKDTVYSVWVPKKLRNDPKYSSGIVVRCRRVNGNWIVDHLYPSISISSTNPSGNKLTSKENKSKINHVENKHKITITNEQEIACLKDLNVVLVGNKYSSGFVNQLKKYCHLTVFDGYEDGEQQIFRAMHSADYVFILIGSVPHSITVYAKGNTDLDENSDKVQIFDVPAKYDGVIRLHYLWENQLKDKI